MQHNRFRKPVTCGTLFRGTYRMPSFFFVRFSGDGLSAPRFFSFAGIRGLLLPVLLLCCAAGGYAQATTPPDFKTDIPKVAPPSPNAAALGKFGEIPVTYSTGIPGIGYPLLSWQKDGFGLSLGLSYHAGGHKVEDMAADVGLGWSLTGTGVSRISRSVRGLPDDDFTRGFMYTAPLPATPTSTYNGTGGDFVFSSMFVYVVATFPADIAITPTNSPVSPTISAVNKNLLDGEQDIFNFSFGGKSGKFVISKSGVVVLLENSRARVQFTTYPATDPGLDQRGRIRSFTITDDDGTVYIFEAEERQLTETSASGSQTLNDSQQPVYTSSWLLTRMVAPVTADTILLSYTDPSATPPRYEGGFGQSQTLKLLAQGGWAEEEGIFYYTTTTLTRQRKLQSIRFPDGAVADLQYGFPRLDLVNDYALSSVRLTNANGRVVKRFALQYSYFTTAAGEPPLSAAYGSGNDFGKRLRLDGVAELAADSSSAALTGFVYNGTALNRRDSRNTDLWGYNVNPARGNTVFVPNMKLRQQDYPFYAAQGYYLGGADRRPDSAWSRAGVLERINYPTGGHTAFTYENNRAFSATNYYEDTLQGSPQVFTQNQWGIIRPISFAGRVDTLVEFFCKTDEGVPRPAGTNNGCLAEQQDATPARFVLTSTDGTVSRTIENTYGNFLAGFWMGVSLPLGKTYTAAFFYDYTTPCQLQYGFTAQLGCTWRIAPQDKLVGGLRIKQVTVADGLGQTQVKNYAYTRADGRASATLFRLPNMDYYKYTVCHPPPPGPPSSGGGTLESPFYSRFYKRSSMPNQSLEYLNGAPLLYSRVVESTPGGGSTERQYDTLAAMYYGTGKFPFIPTPDLSFVSSLPTQETVRDSLGQVSTEKIFGYNKRVYSLADAGNLNIKTGVTASGPSPTEYYAVNTYYPMAGRAEQVQVLSRQYENGVLVTTTENKQYDTVYYALRQATAKGSNGDSTTLNLYYPYDYAAEASMQQLVALNQVARPVKWQQWKTAQGITRLVDGETLAYAGGLPSVNYRLNPDSLVTAAGFSTALNGSQLVSTIDDAEVDERQYENGRLVQYRTRQGGYQSIICDYGGYAVTAVVSRAPVAGVAATSFEADGKGRWSFTGQAVSGTGVTGNKVYPLSAATAITKAGLNMAETYTVSLWADAAVVSVNGAAPVYTGRTVNGYTFYRYAVSGSAAVTISGTAKIDELRLYPEGAVLVSYTHEPLVGITSQCNADNTLLYYRYDVYNRLSSITDDRGRVLKTICYKYNGQPQLCDQ